LESDYYPGVEPWLEVLHAREPLSHVLGSIHYQVKDYRRLFYTGDTESYQELYFDHLALSAESGLFDTLAHPDLIKNEDPELWDFARLESIIARSLDRIAATGAAMELNTSGVLKILPEMNPSPRQLAMMCERGIPVVIGADAHVPERVGDGYETALRLLESVGYRSVRYYVDRLPIDLSIDAALNSLVPSDL
jgi:histidinol-phosphatase (PHP family)